MLEVFVEFLTSVVNHAASILAAVAAVLAALSAFRSRRELHRAREDMVVPEPGPPGPAGPRGPAGNNNENGTTLGERVAGIDSKLDRLVSAYLEHTQDTNRHLGEP